MKQFISLLTTLLLIFLLSCSGVVLGAEEEVPASDLAATLTLTAPDKQYYLTGETPDYSGGYAIYKVQLEYRCRGGSVAGGTHHPDEGHQLPPLVL